jgi:hypothetical protein
MARLSGPKSALGARGRKVRLQKTISHPGQLNHLAQKHYGEKHYFELNDEQRHRILRDLHKSGVSIASLRGKLQIQENFRKGHRDHALTKAVNDLHFINKELAA